MRRAPTRLEGEAGAVMRAFISRYERDHSYARRSVDSVNRPAYLQAIRARASSAERSYRERRERLRADDAVGLEAVVALVALDRAGPPIPLSP